MTLQDIEKQITEFDWPTDERIERIGQNGPTGEHYQSEGYNKVIETGVYES
jgi:hypothetical protein